MGRRLDLKVGFSCNNNCIFCAQAHKRHLGDLSTQEIFRHLQEGRKDNCDEVVFTGGEPTIRKDILQVISYARSLGYKLIQLQTNGRMLTYEKFVDALIDAGVTEFSPAIHGHNALIHDSQTRCKGSFEQTYNGIKNLKERGQYVITNTVITKINYKFLPQITEMLIDLDVNQFQLAFVHPIGNAWKYFDQVVPRKLDVMPFVHKALDLAIDAGYKAGEVMVEAFPFCFMQGYEAFCSELYIPPAEVRDKRLVIQRFEEWRRRTGKVKFEKCKKCKFLTVCEGPWKEYPVRYGEGEFKPLHGRRIDIQDIMSSKYKRIELLEE